MHVVGLTFSLKFSYVHVCMILRPCCARCKEATFPMSCSPPITSWRVAYVVGEIKLGKIFVTIQSVILLVCIVAFVI